MGVNKVEYREAGGNLKTLIDLTADTITPSDLKYGITAHDQNGDSITGTLQPKAIFRGTSTPSASLGNNGDIYFKMSATGAKTLTIDRVANTNGSISGNYYSQCVGISTEDGSGSSNSYASGSQSSMAYIDYAFDFSDIPSDATNISLTLTYKGHEENSSRSTATVQLYSGSTAKGSLSTINGTSNAVYTVTTGSWTRAELDDLIMRFTIGYYGGLIVGCTLVVEYDATPFAEGAFELDASNFTVTSGSLYKKQNGSWVQVSSTSLASMVDIQ